MNLTDYPSCQLILILIFLISELLIWFFYLMNYGEKKMYSSVILKWISETV